MLTDAKNKLDAEISRLETLYYVSTILYGKEMRAKYKQSTKRQALPVIFRSAGWEREVAHNAGHFRVIVEKILPQTLRETIFVRMVSALEVFFTDTVREVYASRRDLLQRQGPIELPYAKLVSLQSASELITTLVSRDCRSLTSGGFNIIEKYFRQQLQVELKNLVGYYQLRELHDRRHLLVHRLGSVDDEYRHKYQSAKRRVSVEQEYLLKAIQTIRDFSSALLEKITAVATVGPSPSGPFFTLPNAQRIPCLFVPFECKNYGREVGNPELDQLAGRFSLNRGKVGFLCCRHFADRATFIQRCRDTIKDDRGLIIPLDDSTVLRLLELIEKGERDGVSNALSDLIAEVLLS